MNEVALFMSALRAALPAQPDPELGAILVPRLAQTARTAAIEAETPRTSRRVTSTTAGAGRRTRSRRALVARVGIAVALIPLVLAGLAFAGVTLPSPARSALESIGVKLPNQPATSNDSSTSEGTAQAEQSKSAAGSKGNSAAAHQHALQQRAKARGEAVGHTRGEATGLNEATPSGQSGDTVPPVHSNAGGSPQGQVHRQAAPQPLAVQVPRGQARGLLK